MLPRIPEVVGDAGILVDPENIEAIAQAMERINQDKLFRQKLIAAGRVQRQQFTWDKATAIIYEAIML